MTAAVRWRRICLQLTVPAVRASVGVALDGDGDRLVMVDENGGLVDGDQLLYVLATARHEKGELKGPVVGTVMSNLGLEHALNARNIEFRRASVGDRYVLETLRDCGGVLGGETSGHMLVLDKTTTGDGLVCALQILAIMKETGKPLSELVAGMPKYPQTMVNVQDREAPRSLRVGRDTGCGCDSRGRAGRQRPGRAAGIGHRARNSRHGGGPGRGASARACKSAGEGRCRGGCLSEGFTLICRVSPGILRALYAFGNTDMREFLVAGNWKMNGSSAANTALLDGHCRRCSRR